jgi:hypothetical protein
MAEFQRNASPVGYHVSHTHTHTHEREMAELEMIIENVTVCVCVCVNNKWNTTRDFFPIV